MQAKVRLSSREVFGVYSVVGKEQYVNVGQSIIIFNANKYFACKYFFIILRWIIVM